jgi:poly-gamma-glutamate synthesis protein (capsule biosynthesis protein)
MSGNLKITFMGDICLGLGLSDSIAKKGSEFVLGNVKEHLKKADLRVGNLECCVVAPSCGSRVYENMMAVNSETANLLDQELINVVTLANNHILDCGSESLDYTCRFLGERGIRYFGAGGDIDEATRIEYITVHDKTVALLGCCDKTSIYATDSKPGVAPLSRRYLKPAVDKARAKSDLIIVSIHSDLEFSDYPSVWRIDLSRWLIDLGVHLVIHHHPHVIQGIETYKDGLIAYSLGNFVFPVHGFEYMESREGTDESYIFDVFVGFNDVRPNLSFGTIPIKLGKYGEPIISEGVAADRIQSKLDRLSKGLKDARNIRRSWRDRCFQEWREQFGNLYWMMRDGKIRALLGRIHFLLSSKEQRRWMKGAFTFGRR